MVKPQNKQLEGSSPAALLSHFAFWFGLLFATPLFIAIHNREDIVFSTTVLAGGAALACIALTFISRKASRLGGPRTEKWVTRILLSAAIVLAIQGNVIHDLFYYGAFNGEPVEFRAYGWKFWAEWLGWLAAFPLALWAVSRPSRPPSWLPALPLLSFLFLLAPPLLFPTGQGSSASADDEIDSSVFAFSSKDNLIHLLPDGFQGDVVRQVFQDNPTLAEAFRGFTLFTDHVGLYQGTAPALYTILTGEPFDFARGFTYKRINPEIENKAYQKRLTELGYQLDYVPISGFICPEEANSCHVRPFNDMKARGYFRHRVEDAAYSVRLIADLSLFRLLPMYLKEKIYNEGRWFFADTTLDGSSPWPDPVIREWTENMHVVDDRPVYKWYHYVGTHIPAKWDKHCRLLEKHGEERRHYQAQALCVLQGIAELLKRLDEAGIYDQTAFLITGDHGHNTVPDDLTANPLNSYLYKGLMGSGRPALLVKNKHDREPLKFSKLPTSLVDVAPTALALAGIEGRNRSAFELQMQERRVRLFQHYSIPDFWTGDPIPYVEYEVGLPASDGRQWGVSDIRYFRQVPDAYDPVNRPNAKGYVLGARLRKSLGNNKASWITGQQLAFIIDLPAPSEPRVLELTLHLPEWMPEQSFRLQLNGGPVYSSPQLKPGDDFWQLVSIPLRADQQREGGNFVSIVFNQLYDPPDSDRWKGAALIKSIRTRGEHQSELPSLTHQ